MTTELAKEEGGIHDRLGQCITKFNNWNRDRNMNNRKVIEEIQQQLKRIQQEPQSTYNKQEEIKLKSVLEEAWRKEEE